MAVEDVVTALAEYYEQGEETFQDLRGGEAVVAVRDLVDLLRRQLVTQMDYGTLWQEFESAPQETAADLAGVLEAMVEADPGLAVQLEAFLEEYYATVGPTAVPTVAEPAEAQPAPVAREGEVPVESHEAEPSRHTDDAGKGTYLYGNVPDSGITVEQPLDLSPDVREIRSEMETLSFDVQGLFDQLKATVVEQAELSDTLKAQLEHRLEKLQSEIMLKDDADEGRVVRHLRRIGELDPDILELLLTGLRYTRSEAQFVIQNAIETVAGTE